MIDNGEAERVVVSAFQSYYIIPAWQQLASIITTTSCKMGSLRVFFHFLVVMVVIVSLVINWRNLHDTGVSDSILLELPMEIITKHVSFNSTTSRRPEGSVRLGNWGNSAPQAAGSNDNARLTFFLVAPYNYTSTFLDHDADRASTYYQNHLNEESAEIWLHRGFARMTRDQGQAQDPTNAHVILIAGYFHLNAAFLKPKEKGAFVDHSIMYQIYESELERIHGGVAEAKKRPHLLLIPSWNPSVAKDIGLKAFAKRLQAQGYTNLWSVGFERNEMWQGTPVERILPIPYVVRLGEESLAPSHTPVATSNRTPNFVFYAGEMRRNAKGWAGCHRDAIILPLQNSTFPLLDVRLVTKGNRIQQTDYNHRMHTSDYCLILCGDTPSSRSLTSAMISGCIPLRVGSRLRGLCEPPCHKGWGWHPTGAENPHLPYPDRIPWDIFPEVDEQRFMDSGEQVLKELFDSVTERRKAEMRSILDSTKKGWIYGFGDPVNSTNFGDAASFIWNSFQSTLLAN